MSGWAGGGNPILALLLAAMWASGTSAAQLQDSGAPVVTAVATRMAPDERLPLTGSVTARRITALSPKVDGFVEAIHVDAGDYVHAGDVVVELDKRLAELEVQQAVAAVDESRARLAEAERQRKETAELVGRKHLPQTELAARTAEVSIQTAALVSLQAERRRREEILARHVIRAPFEGAIASKRTEVGEWVATGSPVVEILELDTLRIEVPVPQRYYDRIDAGTPVQLLFDAAPSAPVTATVTMKIPSGRADARTFPVHIDMPNPNHRYAPGMSVRVILAVDRGDAAEVLLVPRDAIVASVDGSKLLWLVADSDGVTVARSLAVETGRPQGNRIEVSGAGIGPGDRVIVRGNERLEPGQRVRVIQER